MSVTLEQSYGYCRKVARTRARNFYYSFLLLDRARRSAMCAVYAFMRYCDDLSDEPGATAAAMERWRAALAEALEGRYDSHPVWPAFHDTVRRYGIPHEYFFDMIEGVRSDLEPRRVRTFEELYQYCYRVASVVGMTTIHIFGFEGGEAALKLAERCGIAFQLTNILRDIGEDAAGGRIYLPEEDRERFGVEKMEDSPAFRELMRFEGERARAYYRESRPLLGMVNPRSRRALWALMEIYRRLLERMAAGDYGVLQTRVRLAGWEKALIVGEAMLPGAGRL